MFHIKSDKRSQTSAKLIVDGLHTCLKSKSFSDITITDIQKVSSVGRATFYRLFDNLADVLAYECDSIFQQIVFDGKKLSITSKHAALVFFFSIWAEHYELLHIILSSNHLEILYKTFRNYALEIGSIMNPDITVSEAELDYYVSGISFLLLGILEQWIRNNKTQTPEELSVIFENTIKTLYLSLK